MAKATKTKKIKAPAARKTSAKRVDPPQEVRSFKLQIELVPEPLWKKTLHSDEFGLGQYRWTKLRDDLVKTSPKECPICGEVEQPRGHEVWDYQENSDGRCVAKLLKVEIICRRCHDIHHWERTRQWITPAGERALTDHFCRVNDCTELEFERHIANSFDAWRVRSAKKWDVDWGGFSTLVAEAVAAREARR